MLSEAQLALEQLINIETGMRGFVIASKDAFLEPLVAGEKRFSEELDALKRLTADNPEQQRRLASLGDTYKRWLEDDVNAIVAMRRDLTARNLPDDELDKRITSGADKAKMDSMRATLAEISAAENVLLVVRTQNMVDAKHFALLILICGGIAAALLSAILATVLGRSTTARLQLAIDAATAIADGRLDTVIDTSSHDELPKAFDRMQKRLREMIQQISQASNQLVVSVQQISGASEQLSGAIQEQSTSASMMAATIEELTVSIHHVSENADEAHQIASRSGEQSKEGAQVIENTLSSMNGIARTVQHSSTQVSGLGEVCMKLMGLLAHVIETGAQVQRLARGIDQGQVHCNTTRVVRAKAGVSDVFRVRQRVPQQVLGVGRAIGIEDAQRQTGLSGQITRPTQADFRVAVQQAARILVDAFARQVVGAGVDKIDLDLKRLGVDFDQGISIHSATPNPAMAMKWNSIELPKQLLQLAVLGQSLIKAIAITFRHRRHHQIEQRGQGCQRVPKLSDVHIKLQ